MKLLSIAILAPVSAQGAIILELIPSGYVVAGWPETLLQFTW